MKFSKTVGGVDININTDRIDRNIIEAQRKLNMQVASDCDTFIPFQQGALRNSQYYPDGIYGGEIAWNTPYAHYQYEGELYLTENGSSWAHKNERKYPSGTQLVQHAAGTTDHWFEKAKEQHKQEWVDLVKKTAGKD